MVGSATRQEISWLPPLIDRKRDSTGVQALSIKGVPMARVDRAIGILNDDTMDWQVDVGSFAHSEVVAKSRAGHLLDLRKGKPAGDPLRIALGLGHQALVELGRGMDV